MCGICGVFGGNTGAVREMSDTLVHRGPDDSGSYVDDGIALGNRRLSIIDVEGGRQPIHNEDETLWVTYNGEIYNYQSLKEELHRSGHRFYTDTDTEVIVHAYEEWGEDCVERFEGMFAFALWDEERERLFLARDRLGKKPLYYAESDGNFYFASEVKALFASGEVEPVLDREALPEFLSFGYVTGDRTLFEGVHRLPPGHRMTVGIGGARVERYYGFGIEPSFEGGEREAAGILKGFLEDAVERWTVSDVPVGAFLSGGIDSAAVVGLMNGAVEEPLRTFTIGFGTEKFDEVEAAERTAEEFGTSHTSFRAGPEDLQVLPELVYHFDDLVADQAAVPNYLLAERAREDVKVALTGSGGDELFGGYEHYTLMARGERFLKPIPSSLRRMVPWSLNRVPASLLDRLFPYTSELGEAGMERFADYVEHVEDRAEAYVDVNAMMVEGEVEELLGESPVEVAGRVGRYFEGRNILDGLMTLEVNTQLPDKILMKADRTSMANSLELRMPLLNRGTVGLVERLPSRHKVSRGRTKRVFRRAVRDVVPDHVNGRRKQRLFTPIHEWLNEDLDWYVEETLNECRNPGSPLDAEYIEKAVSGMESSPLYYSRQLWNMLNFEVWHDTFITGENVSAPDNI